MLDINANKNTNNNNSKEELEDPNGYYLILFRTLTIDKAAFISVELANKACAYLLTITSTEPTTETNPFNYNITTAALRYSIYRNYNQYQCIKEIYSRLWIILGTIERGPIHKT